MEGVLGSDTAKSAATKHLTWENTQRINTEAGNTGSTSMLTYSEERSLMEDLKEGVEIALNARGRSGDDLDDIKANKLAYLAIQEFDLDITYGWFKYGPAPVDTATRSGAKTGSSLDLNPRPAAEVSASDFSRVPSERQEHPSPEEYAAWIQESEELDRMLSIPTFEYLEHFYKTYAPEEYKSLYLACIHLQRHLDGIDRDVAEDPNREFPTLDDEFNQDLSQYLNNVYAELLQCPQLNEAVHPYSDYKALLKDIIATATGQESLLEHQEVFIGEIVEFFFTDTWRYVSLLISKDTVRGDNADRLRNNIDSDLADLRSQYSDDIVDFGDRADLLGLFPDSRRVIQNHNNPRERDYEDESTTEQLAQWERLAGEVINE